MLEVIMNQENSVRHLSEQVLQNLTHAVHRAGCDASVLSLCKEQAVGHLG